MKRCAEGEEVAQLIDQPRKVCSVSTRDPGWPCGFCRARERGLELVLRRGVGGQVFFLCRGCATEVAAALVTTLEADGGDQLE